MRRHGNFSSSCDRRTSAVPARVAAVLLTVLCVRPEAAAAAEWNLSWYSAMNSPDRLVDILGRPPPEMRRSWLHSLTLGYSFYHGAGIEAGAELQLVRHTGMQRHVETNAAWLARWTGRCGHACDGFSLALGQGLSYAFETPPIEPRSTPDEEVSTRLLNYLLVEMEYTPREDRRWSLFGRIHHRSGVFGLFGNVSGGSNFLGLGLRYRFH